MTAPAGYHQTSAGTWIRISDASGPYTVDAGQGVTGRLTQMPDGWWLAEDGSGPYFHDVTVGTVTAIFPAAP